MRIFDTNVQKLKYEVLREVARQSAGNIAMRIEKDMQMLEAVSRFVVAQPELDIDGVTRVLCEEVESTSFKRMGLITPDGTAHTTDSVEMDLGGRGYFLRAMDGETVISKELTDYADGEPIYVYATPILRGGRAEAVLFATNAADAFASVISNNLNIVMKVLTAITIVMAIPNMVFSFYGMNVSGLPFPVWWVPIVISLIIAGIGTFILVKKDMFH